MLNINQKLHSVDVDRPAIRGEALSSLEVTDVPSEISIRSKPTIILNYRALILFLHMTLPRSFSVISFYLIVALPVCLASIFTICIASNQYVAGFQVAVRSQELSRAGGISELFGMTGPTPVSNDSNAVIQYIESREAVENLGKTISIASIFSDKGIDWFSRLPQNSKIEQVLRYWNQKVEAFFETSTGIITVRVMAFSPQKALDVARGLQTQAELFVNQLSQRARDDSVAFANQEVKRAEERLSNARINLSNLQNKEHVLDPLATAEANLLLSSKIKSELANQKATLVTQRIQLGSDAPSVRNTLNIISGLEHELTEVESESTSIANEKGVDNKPLSSTLVDFQKVNEEKIFAEKAYFSALTSLETARVEADRKQIYLATIVRPGLPEEANFPKPLRDIAVVAGIAVCVWLVVLLGIFSVREHM